MTITELFAGVRVRDLGRAIDFYERLLGAPPTMLPNADEAAWQVTASGWLYVVRDPDAAGGAVLTLLVDDLDERLASLDGSGIETGPVREIPGTVRSFWVEDPEGNRIQLGQPERSQA